MSEFWPFRNIWLDFFSAKPFRKGQFQASIIGMIPQDHPKDLLECFAKSPNDQAQRVSGEHEIYIRLRKYNIYI